MGYKQKFKKKNMLKFVVALLFLAGASQAQSLEKGLLCDICVDVVTDLDEWLTSDTTMETLCVSLIEAQLPEIINGLVEDNLKPAEVCSSIGACEAPTTTTTSSPEVKRFARLL